MVFTSPFGVNTVQGFNPALTHSTPPPPPQQQQTRPQEAPAPAPEPEPTHISATTDFNSILSSKIFKAPSLAKAAPEPTPPPVTSPPATGPSGVTTPSAAGLNQLPGFIANELNKGTIAAYHNPTTGQTFYAPHTINQSGSIFVSGPTGAGPINQTVNGQKVQITHPSTIFSGTITPATPTSTTTIAHAPTFAAATAPPTTAQAPPLPLDYASFGQALAPTITFSQSNPDQYTATYSHNNVNYNITGTISPTQAFNSQLAKNAAVDSAYTAISALGSQPAGSSFSVNADNLTAIPLSTPTQPSSSKGLQATQFSSPVIGTPTITSSATTATPTTSTGATYTLTSPGTGLTYVAPLVSPVPASAAPSIATLGPSVTYQLAAPQPITAPLVLNPPTPSLAQQIYSDLIASGKSLGKSANILLTKPEQIPSLLQTLQSQEQNLAQETGNPYLPAELNAITFAPLAVPGLFAAPGAALGLGAASGGISAGGQALYSTLTGQPITGGNLANAFVTSALPAAGLAPGLQAASPLIEGIGSRIPGITTSFANPLSRAILIHGGSALGSLAGTEALASLMGQQVNPAAALTALGEGTIFPTVARLGLGAITPSEEITTPEEPTTTPIIKATPNEIKTILIQQQPEILKTLAEIYGTPKATATPEQLTADQISALQAISRPRVQYLPMTEAQAAYETLLASELQKLFGGPEANIPLSTIGSGTPPTNPPSSPPTEVPTTGGQVLIMKPEEQITAPPEQEQVQVTAPQEQTQITSPEEAAQKELTIKPEQSSITSPQEQVQQPIIIPLNQNEIELLKTQSPKTTQISKQLSQQISKQLISNQQKTSQLSKKKFRPIITQLPLNIQLPLKKIRFIPYQIQTPIQTPQTITVSSTETPPPKKKELPAPIPSLPSYSFLSYPGFRPPRPLQQYYQIYSPSLLPLLLPSAERLAEQTYNPLTALAGLRPYKIPASVLQSGTPAVRRARVGIIA